MNSAEATEADSLIANNKDASGNGENSRSDSASNSHTVAVAVRHNINTAATTSTTATAKADDSDSVVIAAPGLVPTNSLLLVVGGSHEHPAEIPPEPSTNSGQDLFAAGTAAGEAVKDSTSTEVDGKVGEGDDKEKIGASADVENDEEEEESEYEYEDEDDAAFSGFLVDHPSLAVSATAAPVGASASPARIQDEEGSPAVATASAHSSNAESTSGTTASGTTGNAAAKPRWREPSRQAVSMSLRAEREKTGSKRRLAQDLYRIMNQDTEEAGFSIGPKSEDSMDHWIIKLFKFDPDSNLAKDMAVLGFEHIELEMTFPDQYPFEPPFVRVVRPRFKRQTGFVMNGALCMELLTNDGWNPVNDIESVIVSIRSLLVVGDGRLQTAYEMTESKYQARLKASNRSEDDPSRKRRRCDESTVANPPPPSKEDGGSYSISEAHAAYSHLSDYHKKKGWDSSGWWARKG